MRGLSITTVLLALGGCVETGGDGGDPGDHLDHHPAVQGHDIPLIIGHRGASALCAANTLECYTEAISVGAHAFEADLQVTADGELVMFHDDDTFRQTGERHTVAELSLEEMRTLDLGWGYSPDDGETHPLRGMGLSVSTLREFLDAFPGVPVLLDVKPETEAMAEALARFMAEELPDEARSRLYVKTNDHPLSQRLQALEPAPRVAFSSSDRINLVLGQHTSISDRAPTWIDLNPAMLTEQIVAWAHAQGHLLTVSTVDDPAQWTQLLDSLDLDGIVTNRPDLLEAHLR
jgi:glycerophosphoryl diester phosphodiesterase